ncbi:MAG: L-ribulose-5-phosphate 3-epimerase [Eubacteriales bacterium]|nr:L-ribulose-5-phosphate 3-epimerase [Eubacteriales bacterium]
MLGEHAFGLYEKALAVNHSWEQRLEKARKLGYDYLEICIDEKDERIERLWEAKKEMEIRDAIRQTGVPVRSMCLSAHRRFPFGSQDKKTRKTAYDIIQRAIDFSVNTGVRVIQLAGYDVYYEQSSEQTRNAFLEGLRWSCKRAERAQVMLSMEIMDTEFMNSISKFYTYSNLISSPWLTVYPDLGNLTAWGNDVYKELKLGLPKTVAIHLKDTLRVTEDFPGKFKCVPFGAGCVDFVYCFKILEEMGYVGPYMQEIWFDEMYDEDTQIKTAKSYIEQCFEEAVGQ